MHIKILLIIMAKEAITWRIREHEVVPGAETRARPPILSGHGVAVGDKCVALDHRVSADVGADTVTITLPFIMVDEIARDEDVFRARSRVSMITRIALPRRIISSDLDSRIGPSRHFVMVNDCTGEGIVVRDNAYGIAVISIRTVAWPAQTQPGDARIIAVDIEYPFCSVSTRRR